MACLDVGCGKGVHSALLANKFPKSNFTGIDVVMDAIQLANQQRKENGDSYENLKFEQMNGAKLDDNWSDKYDLVTIFFAAHDQTRPDLVRTNTFTTLCRIIFLLNTKKCITSRHFYED
ncbi:methyltransferase domain protein [Oesophagostomum dentatum]|uniref:Methyltransferase domain protein n=1 Tax=Oesophagostomum dentatum TaxID=61180 RepID=A0A0B1TB99_OESDE|nr:methyltransferase domain protein [Oesophagostomum dentatum]